MSSTSRGGVREVSDYYVTPVPAIQSFLTAWAEDCAEHYGPFQVRRILDPCAGGRIGKEDMSYPVAIKAMPHLFPKLEGVQTLDIRDDSRAERKNDYLRAVVAPADLIITNPPFSHAVEIIEKALRDVKPILNNGGYVVMLQRLNFLGSDKRFDFWQKHAPYRIYVHSQRMGFLQHTGDDDVSFLEWYAKPKNCAKYSTITKALTAYRGQQDSIEYAHFVWWTGWKENHAPHLRVI